MDNIVIRSGGGKVETLYTEKVDLKRIIGPKLNVERASNVEYDNERQGWIVQFADGTYLCEGWTNNGHNPVVFESREAALEAEVAFLQAHIGGCPLAER